MIDTIDIIYLVNGIIPYSTYGNILKYDLRHLMSLQQTNDN